MPSYFACRLSTTGTMGGRRPLGVKRDRRCRARRRDDGGAWRVRLVLRAGAVRASVLVAQALDVRESRLVRGGARMLRLERPFRGPPFLEDDPQLSRWRDRDRLAVDIRGRGFPGEG